jgi:hypothetical protein
MAASVSFNARIRRRQMSEKGRTATINDQAARGQQRSLK